MNEKLQIKIKTQRGLILKHLLENPYRYFLALDFCNGNNGCPFIGYEAPTRITGLQRKGLVISRWSDRVSSLGSRFKEYRLSPDHAFVADNGIIEVKERQSNLFY